VINSPIVDLDVRRENARLRERNRMVEKALLDMLHAPYIGMVAWAATSACVLLGHPKIDPENQPDRCYCRHKEVPPQT